MPERTISPEEQFLLFVVRAMVEHPEDVSITRTIDELGTLLSLHVNPTDAGKIIGKGGQTIKALRILLRVVGAKDNGSRINLRLEDSSSPFE
ncbi:KH domain-containing protein [Candidatus Peregrinibacteria bacterium]|nr:MAG: KH domain-containing protein [Candidatus Peregrinibacteria bacterium]